MQAAGIDLRAWVRSPEGQQMVDSHEHFIAQGEIWQGYMGNVFRVLEDQLTDDELKKIPDLDGTKVKVWFRRNQRLESRLIRKAREMEERRGELRKLKNDIRTAMEKDKEMLGEFSKSDLMELKQIDERMARLLMEKERIQQGAAAMESEARKDEVPVAEIENPSILERITADCGAISPPDHHNPANWLRGHNVGCKKCRNK